MSLGWRANRRRHVVASSTKPTRWRPRREYRLKVRADVGDRGDLVDGGALETLPVAQSTAASIKVAAGARFLAFRRPRGAPPDFSHARMLARQVMKSVREMTPTTFGVCSTLVAFSHPVADERGATIAASTTPTPTTHHRPRQATVVPTTAAAARAPRRPAAARLRPTTVNTPCNRPRSSSDAACCRIVDRNAADTMSAETANGQECQRNPQQRAGR